MKSRIAKLCLITFFSLFIVCICCFGLTSCAPLSADDIINSLLPNVWVFASHLIATVIILCLVIWLGWKPTKNALEKRRLYIEDEIKTAEKNKRDAILMLQKAQETETGAYTKAKSIIETAEKTAYLSQEKITNDGRIQASKIVAEANDEAIKLKEKIKLDNYQQILDIAFSATEALIKKNVDSKENQKLVEQMINDLSQEGEK